MAALDLDSDSDLDLLFPAAFCMQVEESRAKLHEMMLPGLGGELPAAELGQLVPSQLPPFLQALSIINRFLSTQWQILGLPGLGGQRRSGGD